MITRNALARRAAALGIALGGLLAAVLGVRFLGWMVQPSATPLGRDQDVPGLALLACLLALVLAVAAALYHRAYLRARGSDAASLASERRFRVLLDQSPTYAWIKDAEGRFIFLNAQYRHQTNADTWLGRTVHDLWSREQAERWTEADRRIRRGANEDIRVEEISDADGTMRSWLIHKFPIVELDGTRLIAGIGMDISDRVRAEEAQARTIAELQAALDEVKKLRALIPICANCKRIRNDDGYWQEVETYFRTRVGVDFTHSICSPCGEKIYGEFWPASSQA